MRRFAGLTLEQEIALKLLYPDATAIVPITGHPDAGNLMDMAGDFNGYLIKSKRLQECFDKAREVLGNG